MRAAQLHTMNDIVLDSCWLRCISFAASLHPRATLAPAALAATSPAGCVTRSTRRSTPTSSLLLHGTASR
jgi:hypothetical protein